MWSPFFPELKGATAPPRPSLTLYFCLVGAFVLALLPHVAQFPSWISFGVIATVILRSIGELRHWPLPSTTITSLLAIGLLAGIYRQFDTIGGRDAGTALMAGLLAIKFFELRGPRDVALIIFSSFFVVMSSLLYSQALELFVYCLIMMWVLTALLLRTNMGDRSDNRLLQVLNGSGVIFLQALPLALFLFFFCPRYHGALAVGLEDASVGLTDKVEPGSISRLADDESIAMTVKFTGRALPDASTAYWRALVLWNYRDGAWTAGTHATARSGNDAGLGRAEKEETIVSQVITIHPHFHRWLFALDYPVGLAVPFGLADTATAGSHSGNWSEALEGDVLQLVSSSGLSQRERYSVTSAPELAPEDLPDADRKAALELPKTRNDHIDPRVYTLAAQLRQGAPDVDAYILAVLHYFRHGGFVYSDVPGPGGHDALANFLFHEKIGFCEHYASAFAVLMRLGGYPARLVVGYHGAQFNPYGNLYVVKQSNAHCWDEVWIESEKRWRREDPTTVISHIGAGFGSDIADGDSAAGTGISIEVAHHRVTLISGSHLPSWMRRGMLEVQLRREEFEADWDDWVFSYDPQSQTRLAQALGLSAVAPYFFSTVSIFAVAICAFILAAAMRRHRAFSPVENLYAKFCRRLAQNGLPRHAWEGPLAYTERAAAAFPDRRDSIRDLGQIVAQARYAPHPPAASRRELRELLRKADGKK